MYSVFVHIGTEAYSASCSVVTGWGVSLATHLQVVPFLRVSGIRPPLFLRIFMVCISITLLLIFLECLQWDFRRIWVSSLAWMRVPYVRTPTGFRVI